MAAIARIPDSFLRELDPAEMPHATSCLVETVRRDPYGSIVESQWNGRHSNPEWSHVLMVSPIVILGGDPLKHRERKALFNEAGITSGLTIVTNKLLVTSTPFVMRGPEAFALNMPNMDGDRSEFIRGIKQFQEPLSVLCIRLLGQEVPQQHFISYLQGSAVK